MKKLAVTFIAFMSFAFSANAGSYYLHYTLKSGSSGVQGGYSSYNQCMKAGSGSASFASKIETFYCSEDP